MQTTDQFGVMSSKIGEQAMSKCHDGGFSQAIADQDQIRVDRDR